MAARLTPLSKFLITAVVIGGIGTLVYKNKDKLAGLAPEAEKPKSNVPPIATLPDDPGPAVATGGAGCADKPEVRFYHWAWNAQAGLILATGGKQAAEGSLMCKYGVNLKLIREDNTDQMQALLATFAEGLKKGESNPTAGAHFIAIMGDGSATFLKALNDRLRKIGPDYIGVVVGSAGYSRGEDKFMGPPAWKANPQKARGGLVAGVLRDGDWNIALKWLGDNKIPNNPDETSYDPDALNWVAASDYIDAGQKYVSGFCTELKNIKTGARRSTAWTASSPGRRRRHRRREEGRPRLDRLDQGVPVADAERDHRQQEVDQRPPRHRQGDAQGDVRGGRHDQARRRGPAPRDRPFGAGLQGEGRGVLVQVFPRRHAGRTRRGSASSWADRPVNNLADNVQLFGLAPGSANIFAATYTVFGDIVKSQYPKLVPSYYPVAEVLDASLVKELAAAGGASGGVAEADLPRFSGERIKQIVSRRSWDIKFATGSAKFKPDALTDLKALFKDLVVASGTIIEIHGHTDDQGSVDKNQRLSEERAFAVKKWLQDQSNANFPAERTKVFAHGSTEPLDSNSTSEGRAKNRRVEIVLGTGAQI
jgi:outer membrane protein OmpA-like peptidoglycan-associated protein